MTDQSNFLETEQAMVALLDEMEKMRSAAEQIEQAGSVARQVSDSSQKLAEWAKQVLEQSNRQLEIAEKVTGEVQQRLERFSYSQNEIASGVQVIDRNLGETKLELNEKISQGQARLEAGLVELKGEIDDAKGKQAAAAHEQFELINKLDEKWMTTLAGMIQRADKLAKMVNILLVIGIINTILAIALLVLKVAGR